MPGIFAMFLEAKLSEQNEQLRESLKEFFDEEYLDAAVEGAKQYLLGVPVSLRVFASLVLDPTTPADVRSYFSLVAAYMINPDNFSPQSRHGLLGLIDDAYLLHESLEIVINNLDENKKKRYAEELELLKPVFELSPEVRSRLSAETLQKLNIIINYLEKLLEVKAAARERPVYVLPPL